MRRTVLGICLLSLFGLAKLTYAEEKLMVTWQALDSELSIDGLADIDMDRGFRLSLGYVFNDFLMLDLGLLRFGEGKQSQFGEAVDFITETEIEGYSVGLKGFYNVAERAQIYGKLGLFIWDLDFDADVVDYGIGFAGQQGSGSYAESGRDPYFAFGAQFIATDNLSLLVEYGEYQQKDVFADKFGRGDSRDFSQEVLALGLEWEF